MIVVKRLLEFSLIFWLVEFDVKKLFSFGVFLFNADKVDNGGYLEEACAKLLFKPDSFDFLVFAFDIVDAKIYSCFLIFLLFLAKKKNKKKRICVVRDFKIKEIDFFTTKLIKSLIVKFNAQL